jgi:phage terminase large subunit-like protein
LIAVGRGDRIGKKGPKWLEGVSSNPNGKCILTIMPLKELQMVVSCYEGAGN